MKHVLRFLVVAFLLLLTFSTAAYRLNPDVSPEVAEAEQESLSDRISGALAGLKDRFTDSAVDTAIETVTDVSATGGYTETGSEILEIEVPASAVSAVTSQVTEELGGMVTTDDLVSGLNTVDGVSAVRNEDGSLSVTLPEEVYDQYKDELSQYLTGY